MSDFPNEQAGVWYGEMPGGLLSATLDTFKFDPSNRSHERFKKCSSYVLEHWQGDRFAGLYIHGAPGTGKSHAAIGLAKAMMLQGAEVHYRYVPALEHHQAARVSHWTGVRAPSRYGSSTVQQRTVIEEKNGDHETKQTIISEVENDTTPEKIEESVFPSRFDPPFVRNPKTVLVLDDYRPSYADSVRAGIEAASNAGGFVIVTSNFGNPDQLASMPSHELSGYGYDQDAREKASQDNHGVMQAFLSRMVDMQSIEFTGQDHRVAESFWTEMLDPTDFCS